MQFCLSLRRLALFSALAFGALLISVLNLRAQTGSLPAEKDKALEEMTAAYNPQVVYSPTDIDLYGTALLKQGKIEEVSKVYEKLAADYPDLDPAHPEKSPPLTQEAQSTALFGIAKALQSQGQTTQAAEKFSLFKRLYPHSALAKILEANYGIAVRAHQENKDDEAIPLLIQVCRSQAAPMELRANAMLLHAKVQEAKKETLPAIDQFLKITLYYDSVPGAAAEGLWCGAKLLEKQAAALPQASQNSKEVTKTTQLQKAIKAYKDLLAKYPNSPHADEAKARLAVLEPPPK